MMPKVYTGKGIKPPGNTFGSGLLPAAIVWSIRAAFVQ